MRGARAFAFLSEYEGLGLTPLEALAAGVPPVLLDTPVARESCGDAALYVPTANDLAGTTAALEPAFCSTRRRARAAPRGGAGGPGEDTIGRARRARRWPSSERPRPVRSKVTISPSSSSATTRAPTSSAASSRCTRRRPAVVRTRSSSSTTRRPTAAPAAARRWPDVRVIDAGANLGFARANNIGIRASTGEPAAAEQRHRRAAPAPSIRLLAELERHPDVAVVGPRLVDADGRAELSFGRMIGPLNELRQKLLVRGHARRTPLCRPRSSASPAASSRRTG